MQHTDTKDKIIDASFELLLRKGYDGVSISDIQKTMNISRGLLYHYFGSKETLFLEAIKRHFITLFQIDLPTIENYRVDEMAEYIIQKYQKLIEETLKGVSIISYDFLFYRAMQESDEVTRLYEKARNDELKGWLIALSNSQNDRKLRHNLDLEQIAQQFVYTTDGVWMRAVTPSIEMDIAQSLREALETLCKLVKQ